MSKDSNSIKIVTHNGRFHADDVFAVATLELFLEKSGNTKRIEIARTRDTEIINTGDFVVDVGGIHEPENNKFDHHQEGGAGMRENNIPYAAFGLVWKKFGVQVAGSEALAEALEKKMAVPLDALDNGISISDSLFKDIRSYSFSDFLWSYYPTWKEDQSEMDKAFLEVVRLSKDVLKREIKHIQARQEAQSLVQAAYDAAQDKRIIILDKYYPWTETIIKYPEPLFVVSLRRDGNDWNVHAIPADESDTFQNRRELPEAWAGKRDEELQKVTGVPDAVFCHNARFIAVTKTKEGAVQLAKLALES